MKLAKSGDAYFSIDEVEQYMLDQSNIKILDDKNEDYYYINTNFVTFNKNKREKEK